MSTYVLTELFLLFLLKLAIIAVGVKGLTLASLTFSTLAVESQSLRFLLWEPWLGKEERLGSPFSVKRSLDLRGRTRGVERGEEMRLEIAHAELGEPSPSKSLMAFMVLVGGEGDWTGLDRRRWRG